MAKKQFQWIRDAEEPVVESAPRESRAERLVYTKHASRLAKALVKLAPNEWPHLSLTEDLIEMLEVYTSLQSKAKIAKKRALGRISTLLLEVDLDELEHSMGAGRGRTERQDLIEELVRWRTRMIRDGRDAQEEFLSIYPQADRQRLRQLCSRCGKVEGSPAHGRALRNLLKLLKEAAEIG